eukprot:TRINITY_DN3091_c0_g1_i1.p1 TRINITY_DN3091_c0_g1~~TRINITY_DN3091_c0_g1_i1.p1  ORF type:complete len:203 (-),score=50.51 TRINITY_DN3091_c0_g1_i1:9-596(-)
MNDLLAKAGKISGKILNNPINSTVLKKLKFILSNTDYQTFLQFGNTFIETPLKSNVISNVGISTYIIFHLYNQFQLNYELIKKKSKPEHYLNGNFTKDKHLDINFLVKKELSIDKGPIDPCEHYLAASFFNSKDNCFYPTVPINLQASIFSGLPVEAFTRFNTTDSNIDNGLHIGSVNIFHPFTTDSNVFKFRNM